MNFHFSVSCVNYVAKKSTDVDEYGGFLCPRCARTNRVPFSALKEYLDRYENDFDLRLSEAEVLKDLIQRAESWKENLKLVFESLQISSILLVWEEGKNSRSLLKLEGWRLLWKFWKFLDESFICSYFMNSFQPL